MEMANIALLSNWLSTCRLAPDIYVTEPKVL